MTTKDVIKALENSLGKKLILKKSIEDNNIPSFKAYKMCKYELYELIKGKPNILFKKDYTVKILEADKERQIELQDLIFISEVLKSLIYGVTD